MLDSSQETKLVKLPNSDTHSRGHPSAGSVLTFRYCPLVQESRHNVSAATRVGSGPMKETEKSHIDHDLRMNIWIQQRGLDQFLASRRVTDDIEIKERATRMANMMRLRDGYSI